MIDYAKLMTQAAMLRKELGEDSGSPINIFALAQRIDGLTIVYYPMSDKLSGMCIKGQKCNAIIAINSNMTLGRQRYSLAHEFYHLYYDDNMVSICAKKIGNGKDTEKSADMFASYFLMPDAALETMAGNMAKRNVDQHLSIDDVIRIEQYFGVSHQAVMYRLSHCTYMDQNNFDEYMTTSVRRKAESLGLPGDLYLPSPETKRYMTYGNYINQAEQAIAKGLISMGKYEELLLSAFRSDLVYGDDNEGGEVID